MRDREYDLGSPVCLCVSSVLSFLENHFLVIEKRGKVKNWEGATFQKSCSQLFCITFLRFLYLFFLFVFSVCTFLFSWFSNENSNCLILSTRWKKMSVQSRASWRHTLSQGDSFMTTFKPLTGDPDLNFRLSIIRRTLILICMQSRSYI